MKAWLHTSVVIVELDVAVLLSRDGDGESRVTQHFVNLTGRTWGGRNLFIYIYIKRIGHA